MRDLTNVVFYDKPLLKFERLLETQVAFAPRGFRSFAASIPVWLREKRNLKSLLRRELAAAGACRVGVFRQPVSARGRIVPGWRGRMGHDVGVVGGGKSTDAAMGN